MAISRTVAVSLLLALLSICGFAYATSQTDKDLATSQAQVRELRAQVAVSQQRDADNRSAIARLQAQVLARSKEAAVDTRSAAAGRAAAVDAASEAKTAAVSTANAVADVQYSADSIKVQLAQLQAERPVNSVAVWLSAIAAIGALIGTLGSIALALIAHNRVGEVARTVETVKQQTNGLTTRIATLSEEKGHAAGLAEAAALER